MANISEGFYHAVTPTTLGFETGETGGEWLTVLVGSGKHVNFDDTTYNTLKNSSGSAVTQITAGLWLMQCTNVVDGSPNLGNWLALLINATP